MIERQVFVCTEASVKLDVCVKNKISGRSRDKILKLIDEAQVQWCNWSNLPGHS